MTEISEAVPELSWPDEVVVEMMKQVYVPAKCWSSEQWDEKTLQPFADIKISSQHQEKDLAEMVST